MAASPPPSIHSPHSHTSPLSTRWQQEPVTLTARKVDLELLRLKGLGKVTKNSDTEDQKKAMLTTGAQRQSAKTNNGGMDNGELTQHDNKETSQQQGQLEEYRQQLETSQQQLKDHQKQVDTLKEELNAQYDQQEQQLQQEMVKYQTQLMQQEKLAHDTIANYMEKIESSLVNVRKLTLLVEKQDQLIELLLGDENERRRHNNNNNKQKPSPPQPPLDDDWHSLHLEKQRLTTAIGSLKANMETNQAHMQMMMMVSTEIQNDFERQKVAMNQQLTVMADELAEKNALLQHYQEQQITSAAPNNTRRMRSLSSATQQQQPPRSTSIKLSTFSYRPIVNHEAAVAVMRTSDISAHPSLVSSSSSSRSSSTTSSSSHPYSVSSSLSSPSPPIHVLTNGPSATAPSSPPPTIPLPPIPSPQLAPAPTRTSSSSKHQQQQQQQQYLHYQDKQQHYQHGPSSLVPLDMATGKVTTLPGTGSLDQQLHHGKPFWKSMKTKWRNS